VSWLAQHDIGIHLDEARLAVIGKALSGQRAGPHRSSVQAEFSTVSIIARHRGTQRPSARTRAAGVRSPESLFCREFSLDSRPARRQPAATVSTGIRVSSSSDKRCTQRSRSLKPRRHRQAEVSPFRRDLAPCRPKGSFIEASPSAVGRAKPVNHVFFCVFQKAVHP